MRTSDASKVPEHLSLSSAGLCTRVSTSDPPSSPNCNVGASPVSSRIALFSPRTNPRARATKTKICDAAPQKRSGAQHTSSLTQRTRPTHPHAPTHHSHQTQALPAEPHRAAPGKPQQSKAAPRRAGQSHSCAQIKRGIGRGLPDDSFAPTRPPSPLPFAVNSSVLIRSSYR